MSVTIAWYLLVGGLLVAVGTVGHLLRRFWLSTATLYLMVGLAIGAGGLGLVHVDIIEQATFLEHLAEAAVVISLYAAGLKMRLSINDRRWLGPILLAGLTMVVTVAAMTAIGLWGLALPLGAAVLLGAVLAPTDPVLASAVELKGPDDKDPLRLLLTGEAGLNDGTAFPFVLLGVGLISSTIHPLGAWGWQWWAVDVLWRVGGALPLGWLAGNLVARMAVWVRGRYGGTIGADETLALGLIALTYGLALLCATYAFLAVFAAAVSLRRYELSFNAGRSANEAAAEAARKEDKTDPLEPTDDPAGLVQEQMYTADALEKLVEVVVVVLIGVMLSGPVLSGAAFGSWQILWFILATLLVVRPAAVWATLWLKDITVPHRAVASWLGIRGVGTLYYLCHAISLGVAEVEPAAIERVANLALLTVAASIVIHGTTSTPVLEWYKQHTTAAHDR